MNSGDFNIGVRFGILTLLIAAPIAVSIDRFSPISEMNRKIIEKYLFI